jgi:hypothetical protein
MGHFRHSSLCDVVYKMLSQNDRSRYHLIVARALEQRNKVWFRGALPSCGVCATCNNHFRVPQELLLSLDAKRRSDIVQLSATLAHHFLLSGRVFRCVGTQ